MKIFPRFLVLCALGLPAPIVQAAPPADTDPVPAPYKVTIGGLEWGYNPMNSPDEKGLLVHYRVERVGNAPDVPPLTRDQVAFSVYNPRSLEFASQDGGGGGPNLREGFATFVGVDPRGPTLKVLATVYNPADGKVPVWSGPYGAPAGAKLDRAAYDFAFDVPMPKPPPADPTRSALSSAPPDPDVSAGMDPLEARDDGVYRGRIWTTDLTKTPGRRWVVRNVMLHAADGTRLDQRVNMMDDKYYWHRDGTTAGPGEIGRRFGAHFPPGVDVSRVKTITCQARAMDDANRLLHFRGLAVPTVGTSRSVNAGADGESDSPVTITSVSFYSPASPPQMPDGTGPTPPHLDSGIEVICHLTQPGKPNQKVDCLGVKDADGNDLMLAVNGNSLWPMTEAPRPQDYALFLRRPPGEAATFSVDLTYYESKFVGLQKTLTFPAVFAPTAL